MKFFGKEDGSCEVGGGDFGVGAGKTFGVGEGIFGVGDEILGVGDKNFRQRRWVGDRDFEVAADKKFWHRI